MASIIKDKKFTGFVVKFLLIFAVLYYGTLLIIGLLWPNTWIILPNLSGD